MRKGSKHTEEARLKMHTKKAGKPALNRGCLYTTHGYRVNERLAAAKYRAKERKLEWTLSDDEARQIIISKCAYCGDIPDPLVKPGGIDRVDSKRGYTPDNVVACCGTCNTAKLAMERTQFLEWIKRVYTHLNL